MLSIFIATAEIHSRSVMKEALGAGEKVLASGRDSVRFSSRSMPVPNACRPEARSGSGTTACIETKT
jgi:hypothetical protein